MGLLAAKPASVPITKDTRLQKDESQPLEDPASYRRLIGRLLFLTITRPDLSYAVSQLSQHMGSPTSTHHQAAIRVLRYLKSTPAHGLFYSTSSTIQLKAFSDSDWARCPDTRRSITGFLCILRRFSRLMEIQESKKQNTVSRSSSEAEYHALASTICELQWLTYILQELHPTFIQPALLYCDNQSAQYIAANPTFHEHTKHIEIDCHIVREKLQSKLFHLLPISTTDQIADVFTEPLDPAPFNNLVSKLRVCAIHSSACAGNKIRLL